MWCYAVLCGALSAMLSYARMFYAILTQKYETSLK